MKYLILFSLISICSAKAQNYTSYFTGNTTNISTNPQYGVCLMGGATENDNAMQWFLNLADGGDVVVLRTSGSDGYNDYFFNQLGVNLNSVETLLINNAAGAVDPYVIQKVSQAEAIWFAGGDQADYVNYFKNNDLGNLLNEHINTKQYPIGGTSAGMAIMGEYYFDALNGTVTSTEALNDPFDSGVSVGVSDFLNNTPLHKTITDTHYDNPDRKGRHIVFLARLQALTGERVFGIGLEEYTAACIDQNGIAKIYGDYPNFDDFAYFIQVNCLPNTMPETLASNQPLNWSINQQAVKAYKIPGVSSGANQFDLNNWENGVGGEWQNWWVNQGNFQSQISTAIDCENLDLAEFEDVKIKVYPNPVEDNLNLISDTVLQSIEIYDIEGKLLDSPEIEIDFDIKIVMTHLNAGVYFLRITDIDSNLSTVKIIKD